MEKRFDKKKGEKKTDFYHFIILSLFEGSKFKEERKKIGIFIILMDKSSKAGQKKQHFYHLTESNIQ